MAEQMPHSHKTQSQQGLPESTRGAHYITPRVDIYETEDELILYADVPGVRPEDIDLRYERNELLLHAHVRPGDLPSHLLAHEYEVGDFYRVFQIHEAIDPSRISADCKKGVLTVHLPKSDTARPKHVRVEGE